MQKINRTKENPVQKRSCQKYKRGLLRKIDLYEGRREAAKYLAASLITL